MKRQDARFNFWSASQPRNKFLRVAEPGKNQAFVAVWKGHQADGRVGKSASNWSSVKALKDKALDWLEKCYEEQDGYCWGLKVYQDFDPLRTEPRFQALLKKAGLDQ